MDALCTPALVTAALFVALVILDLVRREFNLLPGHGLFGVVAVLLMSVLCQNGLDMAAWGLLAFPFVILILGLIMVSLREEKRGMPYPVQNVNPAANPCAMCRNPKPACACPRLL